MHTINTQYFLISHPETTVSYAQSAIRDLFDFSWSPWSDKAIMHPTRAGVALLTAT